VKDLWTQCSALQRYKFNRMRCQDMNTGLARSITLLIPDAWEYIPGNIKNHFLILKETIFLNYQFLLLTILLFCVLMLYEHVARYQHFGGTYCVCLQFWRWRQYLQPWRWRQYVSPKHCSQPMSLHVTTRNNNIVLTTVRTPNLRIASFTFKWVQCM
jgi:hypothetical protein